MKAVNGKCNGFLKGGEMDADKTADELLDKFYGEWRIMETDKRLSPLDKAESIILIIFSRWIAKHYDLKPKR